MNRATSPYVPPRGDRWSLWAFIVAGAVITVWTAAAGAARIIEVLGPGPVPVEVQFAGAPAEIATGAAGSLPVEVESAVIRATELPGASLAAGVAGPIVTVLTTATIAICLALLAYSTLSGRVFSRRNTRLVTTAVLTGLIGFSIANLCSTMLANGAVAWATDRQLDNLVFAFEPATYIAVAFAGGLIAAVFAIGERLQRDTEGLI